MTIFIGIDPGLAGAMACIHENGEIDLTSTPVIRPSKKKGRKQGRTLYDLPAIRDWLFGRGALSDLFVTVEEPGPMPSKMPGGSIANYHRGVARGWEWMLAGMGIACQPVRPVDWKRTMLAGTPKGDTKQRSVIAAHRLFPTLSLKRSERCHKDDDGIAEALLLAEFGRRTRNGGTT